MRHLLDRPPEHHVFQPQLAGQRAIVAVERRRKQALIDDVGRFARRNEAVVPADAQRIVSVGRLQPPRHGQVLPRSADADDFHARPLALRVPRVDLPLQYRERRALPRPPDAPARNSSLAARR